MGVNRLLYMGMKTTVRTLTYTLLLNFEWSDLAENNNTVRDNPDLVFTAPQTAHARALFPLHHPSLLPNDVHFLQPRTPLRQRTIFSPLLLRLRLKPPTQSRHPVCATRIQFGRWFPALPVQVEQPRQRRVRTVRGTEPPPRVISPAATIPAPERVGDSFGEFCRMGASHTDV